MLDTLESALGAFYIVSCPAEKRIKEKTGNNWKVDLPHPFGLKDMPSSYSELGIS
jgi:hypothetical protein